MCCEKWAINEAADFQLAAADIHLSRYENSMILIGSDLEDRRTITPSMQNLNGAKRSEFERRSVGKMKKKSGVLKLKKQNVTV